MLLLSRLVITGILLYLFVLHYLYDYNNKENIISGDLCILKDVLQHWSTSNIYTFLDYIVETKKFNYILLCNDGHQSTDTDDCYVGDCRALSCNLLPLKKYNPISIYNYDTKQVSIIINIDYLIKTFVKI